MSNTNRHVDTGKHLMMFADEVQISCSDCGAPGVVRANWIPYKWHAHFKCSNCHLALSSEAGDWIGPICLSGRRPCGHCGHRWLTPCVEYAVAPAELPAQIPASCPECGRQTLVDAVLARSFPEDRCCDPHLGLRLRLAVDTRHGVIWAYNLQHLNELSDYVTAKLRVRQNAGNRAMFSRLPKWMKHAKHRDEIAKALCTLKTLV